MSDTEPMHGRPQGRGVEIDTEPVADTDMASLLDDEQPGSASPSHRALTQGRKARPRHEVVTIPAEEWEMMKAQNMHMLRLLSKRGADEEDEMTVGEMPVSESGSKKRKRHDSETDNDVEGQITELLEIPKVDDWQWRRRPDHRTLGDAQSRWLTMT